MKTASTLRKLSMLVTFALVLAVAGVISPFMSLANAAQNNDIRVYDVVIERWTGAGAPPKCDGLPIDNSGARACVNWKWDASKANPQAGDSFYLQLPTNFTPIDPADYDILVTLPNVPEKQKIGSCVFTKGTKTEGAKVTCTFDDGLTKAQAAGNVNLTGTGWIVVRAYRTGDSTSHDFDLNGKVTPIQNPGNKPIPPYVPGPGSYRPANPYKYADSVFSSHKEIYWHIGFTTEELAAKAGGQIPNPLVITDTLSEGQRFSETEAVDIRIIKSKAVPIPPHNIRVGTSDPKRKALSNTDGHTVFDVKRVITNDGRTITITITPLNGGTWEPTTHYHINYNAVPTTPNGLVDRGIVYSNKATVNGTNINLNNKTVYIAAAGGTAHMDPGFGTFSITKLVDGPAVNDVPKDAKVRVAVKWTLPNGKQPNEFAGWTAPAENPIIMELPIGQETVYNPNNRPFPAGTEIEISELDSQPGATVTWTNPRFKVGTNTVTNAKANFNVSGGTVTPIELTNEAVVKKASVCVGDYVFEDVNKDGLQDDGDKPIVGAKLEILAPNNQPVVDIAGNVVAPTTTDDKGIYKFRNLPVLGAGEKYTVRVVELPAGYEAFVPTVAGPNNGEGEKDSSTGSAVTVKPLTTDGAFDFTLDFGYVRTVPGIDIEKYVGDWAGVKFDAGVPQLKDGQPAVLPVGDHDTAADALLLKADQKADVKFTVTNTGTAELTKVTVSDKTNAGPALTDFKCEIEGKTVEAVNGVVTAPDQFKFKPGASFECTAVMPALGDALVHENNAVVEAVPVAGGEPVKDEDPFHAKRPAKVCVGDYVFEDVNKDGLQDDGDKPIVGAKLSIADPKGKPVVDVNGAPVADTVTNDKGIYQFCNLPVLGAGEKYTVRVVELPAGYEAFVPTVAGPNNGEGEKDSSTGSAVTVKPLTTDGAFDFTLDFGYVRTVPGIDIEKYVGDWAGVKFDAGVPQLKDGQPAVLPVGDHDTAADALLLKADQKADVKFTVTNTGTAELTKVTVSDKTNAGPALTDFKCEIEGKTVEAVNGVVTAPDQFKFKPGASFECTAVMPALGDALVHENNAVVEAVPVAGGEPVKDEDPFHAKRPAKVCVGDYVFEDVNHDGLQDAKDKPISGVELTISRTDGKPVMNIAGEEVKTTRTDEDGKYHFCELELLPDGVKYVVTVTPPKGYIAAKANVGTDRAIDSSTGKETAMELKMDKAEDLTLDFGFRKVKPVPPPDLPRTGADTVAYVVGALILAGIGGALIAVRRKKTD
ncbi:MAG: SdrD B-like domain-containing protein [Actinomycetaceae bacterium]|nr:SdrD B-like domain-containing protein [Actinomycetaceae bacterium]